MKTLTDIREEIEDARPRDVAYVPASLTDVNRLCDIALELVDRVEELEVGR